MLECGHSFFVVRFEQPEAPEPDLDASDLGAAGPGLASLSPALSAAFARLARVAPSRLPVVVRGETGVGKERLARAVHALSGRAGPLVAINCGALTSTLYQAELFGYRRGAFSGAQQDREGLVAASHLGTLFLDEIAELPLEGQTALLRVLQEGEVLPVGATRPVPVDLRIVAATHQNLEALVARGRFRADLRARLGGVTLRLPPLRERREDLGLLVAALLERHAPGRRGLRLTRGAARALFARRWRGNVRELERSLEHGLALAEGDAIELPPPEELTFQGGEAAAPPSAPVAISALLEPPARPTPRPKARSSDAEIARVGRLNALLAEHGGNVTKIAEAMGVQRQQIYKWRDQYGLDFDKFR